MTAGEQHLLMEHGGVRPGAEDVAHRAWIPRTPLVWPVVAGILVYAVAYAVVTRGQNIHDTWPSVMADPPAIGAAAAISVRAVQASRWRRPWVWLAGALCVFVAGDLLATIDLPNDGRVAGANPQDLLYLAGYSGFLVATLLFTRPRWDWRERGWIIDLVTALAVVGILAGHYLPIPATGSHDGGSVTVAAGYPLLDVGLLVVIVLAMSAGSITRQSAVLVGALALAFAADPLSHGAGASSPLGNLSYILAYGLLVVFALIGPDRAPEHGQHAHSATGWSSLVLPYAAVALIVAVATASHRSLDHETGITVFAFLVAGAVLGRQSSVLRGALRRERAQTASYSALVAAIPDLLFQIDASGVFRGYRSGSREGLALPPEVFLGKPISEVVPEPIARAAMEAIQAVQATGNGQMFEYSLALPRSEIHDYEARLEAMGEGQFLAVVRDLTEHRKAMEEIARLAAIVESSDDAIVGRDLDGRVTSWNAGAARLFGVSADEVLGNRADFLSPTGSLADLDAKLHEMRAGGGIRHMDAVRLTASGKDLEVSLSAFPVFDRFGTEAGNAAIIRDVTARKLMESQLLHAQKLEGIGRLAGGIAHDFNNLLTAIVGYGELARSSLHEDDPARAGIDEVLHASNRARDLTRQLLAFARKQVVQPEVVSLGEIVRGTESLLRRMIGEDIDLETTSAPGLWPTVADPGQIEQILVNLAVNARDAMPTGGRLLIETANVVVTSGGKNPANVPSGEYVSLTVTDTGCGISEDVRAHLFEPFFTTKEPGKGTGLGLATCYGIVQQAGGHIAAESQPGRGATFTVLLPGVHRAPIVAAGAEPLPVESAGTETILLAEDELVLRKLITRTLEMDGYRVIAAASGAEALERLKQAEVPIDLVLTDMVMPHMSGRELADRALALNPATRVILMSGHSDDLLAVQGSLADCDAFLQKPFTMAELTQRLREVLDARRPELVA
ncbi:MAG: hypothetical protein C0506_04925 [Anaerolinea sp.]|nr:hypothetical protein [Anaerolinea sp.]